MIVFQLWYLRFIGTQAFLINWSFAQSRMKGWEKKRRRTTGVKILFQKIKYNQAQLHSLVKGGRKKVRAPRTRTQLGRYRPRVSFSSLQQLLAIVIIIFFELVYSPFILRVETNFSYLPLSLSIFFFYSPLLSFQLVPIERAEKWDPTHAILTVKSREIWRVENAGFDFSQIFS